MRHNRLCCGLLTLLALAVNIAHGAGGVIVDAGQENASFGFSIGDVVNGEQDNGKTFYGVPNGSVSFDFVVTTGTDILIFDAEIAGSPGANVPGGWFNDTEFGTDVNPPAPLLAGSFPQLVHDTFLTTPGATSAAGTNTLDNVTPPDLVTHFDTTQDGHQDAFQFARVTLIPDENGNASATFRGVLQTLGRPTPVFDDFEYQFWVGEAPANLPVPALPPDISPPVLIKDILSNEENGLTDFYAEFLKQNGDGLSLDWSRHGTTIFAPTNGALLQGETFVIDDLILTRQHSPDQLTELVPNPGNDHLFDRSRRLSENTFKLEHGVEYGGCEIEESFEHETGWIHRLACVPQAESEPDPLPPAEPDPLPPTEPDPLPSDEANPISGTDPDLGFTNSGSPSVTVGLDPIDLGGSGLVLPGLAQGIDPGTYLPLSGLDASPSINVGLDPVELFIPEPESNQLVLWMLIGVFGARRNRRTHAFSRRILRRT